MTRTRARRGVAIMGVLLVVGLAALLATGVLLLAEGESTSASSARRREQARALAWSGLQAVMAELAQQRDALLDGQDPALTGEWTLFELPGGVRGVFRLVPDDEGRTATSELARVDVNAAHPDVLDRLASLPRGAARRIVDARAAGQWGSARQVAWELDLGAPGPGDDGATDPAGAPDDVLTVFSLDPNVQSGLGDDGERHRGARRIRLSPPWTERIGRAMDDRFGQGAGEAVRRVMEEGTDLESSAGIIAVLQRFRVDPGAWPAILDALTATDDEVLRGCIDVNRAPAEVLAAVPGIDAPVADAIVRAREGIDPALRRSVCWPMIQGILPVESLALAADHLTTRSLVWRVRIEGGFTDPAGPGGSAASASLADLDPPPLRDRVILDAVVDVTTTRPRVVFLRDVTNLESALAIAATYLELHEPSEEAADEPSGPSGPAPVPPEGARPTAAAPSPSPAPARWRAGGAR